MVSVAASSGSSCARAMAKKCCVQPVQPKKKVTYPRIARSAAPASPSVRACASSVWKSSQRPQGYPRALAVAPRQAPHPIPPGTPPSGSRGSDTDVITFSHVNGDKLS
eukprot:scaffold41682_cov31-Tisochrysis_lutea.AAC.3